LRELRSSLRQIKDPAKRKEVRLAFKKAADVVAAEAKGRVPRRSGKAANSVRSGSSWQGGSVQAFVLGGRKNVPYYGWLDFGSRNPRRGNPRSVGPWAGTGPGPSGGRFIYAAIEDKASEVESVLRDGVTAAFRAPDVDL